MTSRQRLGLIALAAIVAAVAFAIARPGDDENEIAGSAGATTETAPAGTTEPAPPEPTATAEAARPEPEPEVTTIRVRGGEPVGGVREITVERGEVVRLVVSSDEPHHIHLHGYDVIEDAAPGNPARFRFRADLEGIFEIELEGPHVQIASLRVEP